MLFEENNYLVLARKYRPNKFADIIGQDVLVRTFKHAIESDKIAHAFILTGIRGVGKTTAARVIAKSLNCTGKDSSALEPCGICNECVQIINSAHPDVMEIDAASNTGVNDVRTIIENCRYKPLTARYKVYIIDEVHMLSNSAFNALLKTLEEPPAHVKFIFATTEIKKLPLTIISRCQRFDLNRVSIEDLKEHFLRVLTQESIKASDECLQLIASSARGSVRDGLSLLDQAISYTEGKMEVAEIRSMLGLSECSNIYKLFSDMTSGKLEEALKEVDNLYHYGSDPMILIEELMQVTHNIAKLSAGGICNFSQAEKEACQKLAAEIELGKINRIWLGLVQGYKEMKEAPDPYIALEMLIVRIGHFCMLPSPDAIFNAIQNDAPLPTTPKTIVQNLEDVAQILLEADERLLYHHVRTKLSFIKINGTELTIKLLEGAPGRLVGDLKIALEKATQQLWTIICSSEEGEVSLSERTVIETKERVKEATQHYMVQEMLGSFESLEVNEVNL